MPGTTVLLVDDEEEHRARVRLILERQQCLVYEAASYSAAMSIFDTYADSVQLLITAIALPDGNGCSLAIAMREQKPGLRVLFVSFGVGIEAGKYHGLRVPSLYVLKKPFRATELVRRVNKILQTVDSLSFAGGLKTLTAGRSPEL